MTTDHSDQQDPGDQESGAGDFSLELIMAAWVGGDQENEGDHQENYLQNVLEAGQILAGMDAELEQLRTQGEQNGGRLRV